MRPYTLIRLVGIAIVFSLIASAVAASSAPELPTKPKPNVLGFC
jgi:hypothetical protein